MPIVPEFSEEILPPNIKALFAKARAGKISPSSFLESLEKKKVDGFMRVLYTVKAFDLTLSEVKELEFRRGGGLTGPLEEDAFGVLDKLKDLEEL